MTNLKCEQFVNNSNCSQFVNRTIVLPTKESQCRPLATLSPEQQVKAWNNAVEKAGGKVPTAKIIKKSVTDIMQTTQIQNKNKKTDSVFQEVNYNAGTGVEYAVRLDRETFKLLQKYQDKIGSATKNGAIARLLNDARM